MYFTKRFIVGLSLAIVGGLVVAAAQASFDREYDETPLTVPVGLVGDAVTYATFEKGRAEPNPQPWPVVYSGYALPIAKTRAGSTNGAVKSSTPGTEDAWGSPVLAGSRIGPVKAAIDATGLVHDVIPLHSNGTGRAGQTILEYVDLESRQVIRSESKTASGPSMFVSADFQPHSPELFGLQYQGVTLNLGQDVSAIYPLPDWVRSGVDEFTVSSKVERRSLINGIDAYGIRTEMGLRQGVAAATSKPSQSVRMTVVEYTYIGSEIPYPLLVHRYVTWVAGDQSESYEVMVSLIEYQRGTTPIPWTGDAGAAQLRPRNLEIERTKGSRLYPEEGTGRALDYTLSQAVEDVKNDASLIQFHQWQADNPHNVLVGAQLRRGSSASADSSSLQWTLFYGVPSGGAYYVKAERAKNPVTLGAATYTTNGGAIAGMRFDPLDFPPNPVTLGAADTLWYGLAHSDYTTRPNFVNWGFGERYANEAARETLRRLSFGYMGSDGQSRLTLDTETGNLEVFRELRTNFDCACFTLASAKERPIVAPKTVPAGLSPPTVEAAAVTTSASLAVFLAAYFLPLLQFALFAGFAKLRKEDILDNRLRDQILHLIKAEPGIHASDIARRVEAGWGTIVYHLSVLERNKLVSSLVDGRHKRFFPIGIVDFSRRGQLAVLRNDTTKTIFEMIAQDPGIIQGDVAGRSSLSVPAAIWHLKRLEDAGLVGRAKEGRRVHYFANKEEDVPIPYDERDAVEIV